MLYILIFTLTYVNALYPKPISLQVVSQQNQMTIVTQCDQSGMIYYAAIPNYINITPTIISIKQYISLITKPEQWAFYGKSDLIQQQSAEIRLNSIQLNQYYNVIVYCENTQKQASYPISRDLVKIYQNGSRTMIVTLYSDTTPTIEQQQQIACQTIQRYPQASSRVIINEGITCNGGITKTTTNIASERAIIKPQRIPIYILQDDSSLQDFTPEDLLDQDPQDLGISLSSNSKIALSTATTTKVIDTTLVLIQPELNIESIVFSNKQLVVQLSLKNMDGIIVIGISELLVRDITLSSFFIETTKLKEKAVGAVQQSQIITYTISSLTLGKDYLLHVSGLIVIFDLIVVPIVIQSQFRCTINSYPGIQNTIDWISIIEFYCYNNNCILMNTEQDYVTELDGVTIENIQGLKRSSMQASDIHAWYKKRHSETVKKKYMFFPEEIKQQLEVKKIFQNFDRDNSKYLDMVELQEMFQKNGFNISETQLQRFFKIVDQDKDSKLNWNEFKNSTCNTKASKVFRIIMLELRKQMEQDKEQQQSDTAAAKYMPLSFNNMISYLSFLASRDELQEQLDSDQISFMDKFKKYQDLINLTSQFGQNKRNESLPDLVLQEEDSNNNLQEEHQFTRKATSLFKFNRDSFYKFQSTSKSPKHKHNKLAQLAPSLEKSSISNKLPKRLRDIDAIVKTHKTPLAKTMYSTKDSSNSTILKLKEDVSKYITMAKTQYNINVDEIYEEREPKKPIKIKIKNFETEFRTAIQKHQQPNNDSLPYFTLPIQDKNCSQDKSTYLPQQHDKILLEDKQLSVIEESSKRQSHRHQSNCHNDHLPKSLIQQLRDFQRTTCSQKTPLSQKTTLFKTQSDFTKTTTNTKQRSFASKNERIIDKFQIISVPQTAKHARSQITTASPPIRISSQAVTKRNLFKKTLDIEPLLGKSILK